MRYLIKIILLLIALSFVGAGTAFYTDTINLDTGSVNDDEEPDRLTLEHAFQDHSGTQYMIDLWIEVEDSHIEQDHDLSGAFTIKLLSHDREVADLTADHDLWIVDEVNEGITASRFSNQIHLDQKSLDLPDGLYALSVTPNAEHAFGELVDPITISIRYSSITEYQVAVNESPAPNSIGITLFFPDESSKYLIPVTRFVPQTNTTLRETVRQLEAGPSAALGLFDRSPIPPVPRIQLSGGTASLYLSSQLGFYNEYPNIAQMAASSLVESLGSIPEVNGIQFYFDNRILDEGFIEVPTGASIEPDQPPFIYPLYRAPNGRALLIPYSVDHALVSVQDLMQLLSFNHNSEFYSTEIQPTIPQEVELIDFSLEDTTLMVNFTQEFNQVFTENSLQGLIMLDSILFSLTSIEAVDSVLIRVNGEVPAFNISVSFTDPLEAPSYINPEL